MKIRVKAGAPQTLDLTLPVAMAILRAIERILKWCVKLVIRKSIGLWPCPTSWELTKLPAPLTWEKEVIRISKIRISAMSFSQKDLDPYSPSTRTLEYNRILVSSLSSFWRLIRPNSQHSSSMSLVKPLLRWFNSQASIRLRIRRFSTKTKTELPHLSSLPRIRRRWSQVTMR